MDITELERQAEQGHADAAIAVALLRISDDIHKFVVRYAPDIPPNPTRRVFP